MQATGQYGVSDQFVVPRPPPALMFALSQDMSHGHPHHLHPSLQHQHVQHRHQQQQQQHHQQQHPQHHHPQHPQHTQHSQHPQHSQHAQHPQHQQQQQHQHLHQQHAQHQQQQAMAQQLGLGPDSPEDPSPDGGDPSPTSYKQRESLGDDDGGEDEGRGSGGNRWPRQETLALIKIRSEMDADFRDSSLKGPLWEDVSRRLAELGYQRSAKKCKEKFENVHKYYKKTKDGRAGRQDGKSYRFFSQLEALYGGGGGTNSQHADGGSFMLTGGSGGPIGGGAEGNVSSQRPAENSSGLQLSSDSDEDDYDDPGDNDDDPEKSKKRKRKEGRVGNSAKMLYFESLLKKLMEKQEAMQRKFLETIERREQDRLAREDAWRRQEMARMTREHEMRAQEHALAATRDAALVAFLQKVTGQTLQLPQIVPPQPLNLVVPETHQADDQQEKETFDPSKRWPKPEVHALIRLRSQLEPKFQEAGPKGPLWEEISTGMACLGFSRNSKRCKEKWENINKYFRKSKETNKKRPDNAKTCPYFQQLDMLYRNGALGGPNNKLSKLEENSDDLVDHPSNREDSEHNQDGDADGILAIMPAGEGTAAASTNGGASHFYSSADNGSSGDRNSKKVTKQTQILASPSNGDDHSSAPVLALNFDGLHRGDGETFSGNHKSVRLEGLVKNMLEQQQQHQMRFDDDFERGEREMREHERRQQEDYRFAQERAGFPQEILCSDSLGGKLDSGRIF